MKNGKPSKQLKARLDRAIELYHKRYFKNVMVSGTSENGIEQANVMMRYLIRSKIPKKAILVVTYGDDIYSKVKHARLEMKRYKWKSLLIITHPIEMRRAKYTASRLNISVIHTSNVSGPFGSRNFFSFYLEFMDYCIAFLKTYEDPTLK